jgi:hypothetical protein
MSRPAVGSTQPPIQWAWGALSAEVKRPWREADHWPFNAEVKNEWIHNITPSVRLHGMYREIFTDVISNARGSVFKLSTVCLTNWKYGLWQ